MKYNITSVTDYLEELTGLDLLMPKARIISCL